MVELNLNEKVVLKGHSTLLDGFSQKQGKLYLTNERLIFENKKNSSNNIYIKLEEIKSYKELRLFLKLKQGFDIKLNSEINYCFSLGFGFGDVKKWLLKLEDTKGTPLEKETEIKHFWLPNIIFGLLIMWYVIIPTISFVGSSINSLLFKLNPIGYIENVDKTNNDVSYDFEIDNKDFYYPNLHGEWSFYDSHNDRKFNLRIKLKDYYTGHYEVWTKWDWDKKWKMEEEGKFEIGISKDEYGDSQILGYRIDDLKYKSDFNDRMYIFSVNSMLGGYGLRLGPRFEVWNSMFGERMSKVDNQYESSQKWLSTFADSVYSYLAIKAAISLLTGVIIFLWLVFLGVD